MSLFGTDGIRGQVNIHPMTPETVVKVGMAAAKILKKDHGKNMVVIGKDTRISGYIIESALTAGICSMGMNVMLVGPIPTPGVAFLTRAMRLDAGVVISASHNPYEDNGIKFFGSDGFKLPDDVEEAIEHLVLFEDSFTERPFGKAVGKAYRLDDAAGRYIEFIKSTISRGSNLEGIKVVVDCANGAAYKVTPKVLSELGAEVITINDNPDGININAGCGSTDLKHLKETVLEVGAHVGIAHDGDADRTILVDEKGKEVDGDMILALWAVELKKQDRLADNTVVVTVMTNLGIEHYLKRKNIRLVRTPVGDRYVVEEMKRNGYILGGEQSGHIIFFEYNTTGDGPVTALQMLYLLKKKDRPFSEIVSDIYLYPQILTNVKVKNKKVLEEEEVRKRIQEAENELNGSGRVLVRPSGTEPKVRVMVEGLDRERIESIAEDIARVIKDLDDRG